MAKETVKKSRYNEKVNKTTIKYIHDNYDQFVLRLHKNPDAGLTRSIINNAAKHEGMSASAFVVTAVKEKIERDIGDISVLIVGESEEKDKKEGENA